MDDLHDHIVETFDLDRSPWEKAQPHFEHRARLQIARVQEYRASSHYREIKRESDRRASAKRYADPEKKAKILEANKAYRAKPGNKERQRAYDAKRHADPAMKAARREYSKAYRLANKERIQAYDKARRGTKLRSTGDSDVSGVKQFQPIGDGTTHG